jgi:hypothetical protein
MSHLRGERFLGRIICLSLAIAPLVAEEKSVSVVFSSELILLKARLNYEIDKDVELLLGRALADSLTDALTARFSKVTVKADAQDGEEYDYVVEVAIEKSKCGLRDSGGSTLGGVNRNEVGSSDWEGRDSYRKSARPSRYVITLNVKVYDAHTLKVIRTKSFEGAGTYIRRNESAVSENYLATASGIEMEAKKLKKACDDAIAQVTEAFSKGLKGL